jgi:hypothetical protein
VALLLPETDIIGNAAFLAGIVPECESVPLEEKSNFEMKTPPLPEKKNYTPIVYVLEDITPEKRQATVERNKSPQETVVDLTGVTPAKSEPETSKEYHALQSFGISAFGKLLTSSLPQNPPCESYQKIA